MSSPQNRVLEIPTCQPRQTKTAAGVWRLAGESLFCDALKKKTFQTLRVAARNEPERLWMFSWKVAQGASCTVFFPQSKFQLMDFPFPSEVLLIKSSLETLTSLAEQPVPAQVMKLCVWETRGTEVLWADCLLKNQKNSLWSLVSENWVIGDDILLLQLAFDKVNVSEWARKASPPDAGAGVKPPPIGWRCRKQKKLGGWLHLTFTAENSRNVAKVEWKNKHKIKSVTFGQILAGNEEVTRDALIHPRWELWPCGGIVCFFSQDFGQRATNSRLLIKKNK